MDYDLAFLLFMLLFGLIGAFFCINYPIETEVTTIYTYNSQDNGKLFISIGDEIMPNCFVININYAEGLIYCKGEDLKWKE